MEKDSAFRRAVDSIMLQRVSRIAMVLAAACLPIAGWGLKRLVDKADTVVEVTVKSARKLDLLEQQIRLTADRRDAQILDLKTIDQDHEGRIRTLERDAGLAAGAGKLPRR